MNEIPYYCPICGLVLTTYGTDSDTIYKSSRCVRDHYACSQYDPKTSSKSADASEIFVIGTNDEMFKTGCKAIRVFYLNGEYLSHEIDMKFIHKRPFKIGLKLNDEIFLAVFSRDNLHPLLEKLEKYEIFS